MKFDCIVCASEFEDVKDSARVTCSEKCRKKYFDFWKKLRIASPRQRNLLINEFLAPIDAKLAAREFLETLRNT